MATTSTARSSSAKFLAASATTSESVGKKDVQKLQRIIVDGLEDVKAQDIVVFDTEALSALFERVIIASGTSNRQTKALASSVRDAVREAGFPKPRIEGEENGEWIIVDCGAAVVHIMQPAIRQYYHLEELWGETPVRMKFGAAKPVVAEVEKAPAKKAKPESTSLRRSSAVKTAERDAKNAAEEAERAEKLARAAKTAGRKRASSVKRAAVPGKRALTATGAPVVAKKAPAKKSSTTKPTTVVVKAQATTVTKAAAKTAAVKSPAKKAPVKRATAKKAD